MPQTILYYPNINIDNGQWLRNALLYWDNISSIVPYRNFEDLSTDLLYLQGEGIYEPIYPQYLFKSEYNYDFERTFIKRLELYGDSKSSKRARIHKDKVQSPELLNLIHKAKIPPRLERIIDNNKYINDYNADGWMEIDEKIAQIYMRTLAEYSIKTSDKEMVLGTDNKTRRKEIYPYSKNFRTATQCCEINIVDCLPQPSLNTSLEDIIRFKEQRKDELIAFQLKISELESHIYKSSSIEEIRHYENHFAKSLENYRSDYYKVLKEAGIIFTITSLCTLVNLPFFECQLTKHGMESLITPIKNGAGFLNVALNSLNLKSILNPHNIDRGFSYIIKANEHGMINL